MKTSTRQVALWASIGLNVAFVLALAVVVLFPDTGIRILAHSSASQAGRGPGSHGRGDPLQREFERIAKVIELTPDQRAKLQPLLDSASDEGRKRFGRMREERNSIFRSVIENLDDDEAFRKTIEDSRSFHEEMATEMLSRFREMVRELTPEQRTKLLAEVDRLEGPGPPPPGE
jgi:Spy/CpxP family protein refolding chaperone